MSTSWYKASDDVILTAQDLIGEHHPHLLDVRIVFMLRSEPAVSGGKLAYTKTQKAQAQMQPFLDDADFIIWFSEGEWMNKTQEWRRAIMDHALSHCGVSDDGEKVSYYIRPHDIEEFHEVIARHGNYSQDISGADQAIETAKAKQLYFSFSRVMEALAGAPPKKRGGAYTVEVKSFRQAVEE